MKTFAFTARIAICAAVLSASSGSFAAGSPTIAYFNKPDSHTAVYLKGKDPVKVASVELDLKTASKVLVQFTSGIADENSKGCPCSVRAYVTMDGEAARPVKRVNVASPAVQEVDKYEHDRQNLDASTVYEAPKGMHTFTVTFQKMGGDTDEIEVYYPNLQAIVFPN
ncbi:hypothetical protein [Paraburkholderia sartisoli]|uniref:Uncharacterized protein n=1 Tax=Paraburkholderia sartisoli TaxID=83784 RepID=A0A1H4D1Z6_9BURK|nr:hypothetical protein [Paraburkholderia sartisoli]SEA66775.1 hypothetical protein SAMN05192564_102626 [Paraburkholderia sartisoli]